MYMKINPEDEVVENVQSPLLSPAVVENHHDEAIDLQDIAIKHLYPDSLKDVITWPSKVLGTYLLEECVDKPPSLENLLVWGKEKGFTPSINPDAYTFISHMHDNAFPNKLGPGQIDSICSIPGNIWLDLTSMYQGCWGGYEYVRHTKPIVQRLHEIMLGSTEQAVVLSGYDTDPMRINGKLKNAIGNCETALKYDFFVGLHEKLCDGRNRTFRSKLDEVREALPEVELPVDKYFSRLWCYVERLAVHGDVPNYVLNGKGGKHLDRIVSVLSSIQTDLITIANYLHFPMNKTITVFQPYFYNKRHIVYSIRSIEGVLATIRKLWGVKGSQQEGPLDPWSSVESLECYCDADRVIVYSIECSLRGVIAKPVEYCAALQIALGRPELAQDQLDILRSTYCPDKKKVVNLRGVFRESFGMVRQIDALQVARENSLELPQAIETILNSVFEFIAWIDVAQRSDNLNIRMSFWSLIKLQKLKYYILHRKMSRHFRLEFDGNGWNVCSLVETPINTFPLPKTFNPMSNMKSAIKATKQLMDKREIAGKQKKAKLS